MISSVIPARLEFSCGHVALVSLPRLKGESPSQRTERVAREKTAARGRACDFCGPREEALLEVHPVEVTRLGADETRRTFPPRRRLTEDQEREVARIYAETTLPVPDISKQFSIGESSVYRIAQRHGAGLRRRTPVVTTTPVAPATTTSTTTTTRPRRGRPAAPAAKAARAAAPPATAAAPVRKRAAPVARTRLLRFRIHFRVETVVRATDVRAALRQVESLGATDVIAIVRQDR